MMYWSIRAGTYFRNIQMQILRNLNVQSQLTTKIYPVNHLSTVIEVKDKWDLCAGICLERKPKITKTLNQTEIEFKAMLNKLELENSMKSDFEIRQEGDKRRSEMFKQGKVSTDDLDKSFGQSTAEFEDENENELKAFHTASRETEADKKNDTKSTERSLDKHLVLITEEKLGDDKFWLLPFGKRMENETLKETAERILKEKCGNDIKVQMYGNAPCGFFKYKYPVNVRQQRKATGAKIFYFKMAYLGGDINKTANFSWSKRDELASKFTEKYYKSINLFLVPDEN